MAAPARHVAPAAKVATASLPVKAAAAGDYYVTYVARVCNNYSDIMANRARNNIQESLQDLGQDTVYKEGDTVRPGVEESVASQAAGCRPLPNWRLTLGTGYTGKTPSSLYLSTVTGAYSTSIVTKASTPLLDPYAQPTGDTIDGAVTVQLTADQIKRAQQSNSLWVQGGTPSQPLNGVQEQYGFGALRCAVDNLNGDNVEWVGFPSQYRHVFCYYFAVQPPPSSSTIIVKKQLAPGTSGPAAFRFDGNISYDDTNGDGTKDFLLKPDTGKPASITFIRGAGLDWNFEEQPTPGFVPTGPPVCSTVGGTGNSSTTIVGQKVTVTPAPGATITCTYTNQADVTGPLKLSKVTVGGTGRFDFDVNFPTGTLVNYPVTTTEAGVPAVAANIAAGPTGDYSVTENLPADSPRGSWALSGVDCNGAPATVTGTTFGGTVGLGQSADCVVTNTFTPGGSLKIRKTTVGGVGTFGYSIQQVDRSSGTLTGKSAAAKAVVTQENTPTPAVVNAAQSNLDLSALPVDEPTSTFGVTELLPPETAAGRWQVKNITCDGQYILPKILGGTFALVTLTSDAPDVTCDFTNEFLPSIKLTVDKVITGPDAARGGDVVIGLVCNDDDPVLLTVPTSKTSGSIGPFVYFVPQQCSVDEIDNGLASTKGASVKTTITAFVDGQEVDSAVADGADFDLSPGDNVLIRFTDAYSYSPPDSSGGGGGSGAGGSGGQAGGQLPDTGAGLILPTVRAAGGLIMGGLILVMAAAVVRRRYAD
jgi:hypothetical protein